MWLSILLACGDKTDDTEPTVLYPPSDVDQDGFSDSDGDCDDNDPNVNPDAEDTPNDGIDQDCSGGDAQAPELGVSESALDLQNVEVGCTDSVNVTLRNSGQGPLTLIDVSLSDDSAAIELQATNGTSLSFPIILMNDQLPLTLTYSPLVVENWSANLVVESDAYDASVTEIPIVASSTGRLIEHSVIHLDARSPKPVDILFAVDVSNSMMTYGNWFMEIDGLLDALNTAGLSYRLSAIMHDDGCVQGNQLFVDNTFTSSQGTESFAMMLDDPNLFNITQAENGFTLLQNALDQTGSGECNEGLIRPEAQLILVGVSDEPEQSPQSYSDFLTSFRALKTNPNDVIVHAIGRDASNGCSNAQVYTGFVDAVSETGGMMVPICTANWRADLRILGEQISQDSLPDYQTWQLDPPPVEETLEIRLNEQILESGWSYNSTDNRLVFDNGMLAESDLIDLSYYARVECP